MIIDGRKLAAERTESLKFKVQGLKKKPNLAVILVGNDKPSEIYVSMKAKKAAELGIDSQIFKFDHDSTDTQIISKIKELNADAGIHGILVQLPFPQDSASEANEREIVDSIDPKKDVDGLTSANLGLLFNTSPRFYPATVKGILHILESVLGLDFFGHHTSYKKIKYLLAGKNAVIIGRSEMVGKPLAATLINFGATVTVANAKTVNLYSLTNKADILITATGVEKLITVEMVKPGSIVIDCGAPVAEVDPTAVQVAGFMTPVPGGVGPMTIISLLENTVEAAKI